MSQSPLSDFGSSNADATDYAIQRRWNRFAMVDQSVDPEPEPSQIAAKSPQSTDATIYLRALDSLPGHDATTALGNTPPGPARLNFLRKRNSTLSKIAKTSGD